MQTVTTNFTNLSKAMVRPINWALRISWDKTYDDTTSFFKLDTSMLDGSAILSPTDTGSVIQAWDFYKYLDYTSRAISLEITRENEFPYSVSSAIADITLNNYDNYFTYGSGSPIADYILPIRPVRILAGFGDEVVNNFVGVTETMPEIDNSNKRLSIHCVDFLSQIYDIETDSIVSMSNVRTDEVLAALFESFGIPSSSYSLDEGINVIPFLFYEKGTKAGTIIKSLMQAEIGNLWINEAGIIVFNNRYHELGESVATFNDSNIVSISGNSDDTIYNYIEIKSNVRELQEYQPVYSVTNSTDNTIAKNGTAVFSLNIDDPCSSITEPTLGELTTNSWFTAIKTEDSTEVTSGVTCTGHSLKTNSISIFFENTNDFEVTINSMEIWGYPAKVIDTIDYVKTNENSISKFGTKTLEIDNDFIQSISQCDSIAVPILLYYSDAVNQITVEVKSNPALELDDVITIDYAPYSGEYRIIKSIVNISGSKMTQTLTCQSTVTPEFFTLDSSTLNGTDLLAP